MSLHHLGKELVRCTNENHKTLMDGLSAVELDIKQLALVTAPMPRQPEMSGLAMPRQPEMRNSLLVNYMMVMMIGVLFATDTN